MGSRFVAGLLALVAAAGLTASSLLAGSLSRLTVDWVAIPLDWLFVALGYLVAVRRPRLGYGWLLLVTAVCFGLGTLGTALLMAGRTHGWEMPWAVHVMATVLGGGIVVYFGLAWVFVPLLFPEGRLPSRRWRPVAWVSGLAIAVYTAGYALAPQLMLGAFDSFDSPDEPGVAASFAFWALALGQTAVVVMACVVLVGLVVRWRRSAPAERGQYAWMTAGTAVTMGAFLLLAYTFAFGGALGSVAAGLLGVVGALPAGIGVAVVRHRLLDIRIGIRGSRLLMVFDVRPTVGEVLSGLGTALEDTPEPVVQLGSLAGAVRAGLGTRWAAITAADGTRVVAGREEGTAALTLDLPGGRGRIECGPRDGDPLTGGDRRLLEALAVPAGLAVQSAGLAARLVNAQEAERRRLERNIHDGVQQQLVALIAGLELARASGGGPAELTHLREQARQTLADLRELAAGIHPSVLTQGGLVEAVEERCAGLPVPTTVGAGPELRARRFPDEVEGAMYFTVSEAVANALKHAAASKIKVRLTAAGGRLRASVTDDGEGFDPASVAHRGLAALADRLDALGGGLALDSRRGEGTRMEAWVPVDA